jgi:hypothetical protein
MFGKKKSKAELTIKGKYFLSYCEKIAGGVWTERDYIEAYEDSLKNFIEGVLRRVGKAGEELTWEQLRVVGAKILVQSLKEEVGK